MNSPRGSLWRKCDFHIHSPYSHLENQFGNDIDKYVTNLFKKAIEKNISIIAITDYFTIDGYKKVRTDYLEKPEKLKMLFSDEEIRKIQDILIIPNVEFRLNKIVQIIKTNGQERKTESGRINFHILLSDQLSVKTIEESFLHDIDFIYEADPNEKDKKKKLKLDNLIALGKRLKEEQPELIGDDAKVGMTHAVVNDEDIAKLLTENNDFKDKYLIVVPSDEDLSEIQWKGQDHMVRKILISRSHALFSSNKNTIQFGLAQKSGSEAEFLKEFKTLKPCIWGSDAHEYDKMFEPDQNRYCWIKGDPTFEGIRQILFEPTGRTFIGEVPKLVEKARATPGNYIDSLTILKKLGYDGRKGIWFEDFKLSFGLELIAIIGNKGKGKSAIADVLALLGNAHVKKADFSFLRSDKFCQKGFAENFTGNMRWFNKATAELPLNGDVDMTGVERVKYIPQSYLEKLCNNEDSGFREEINKVVFSRLDDTDKLGKQSFSELEAHHTGLINQKIEDLKIKLSAANREIDGLLKKSEENYRKSLDNKLAGKRNDLALHEQEHGKIPIMQNPEADTNITQEQRTKAEKLFSINAEVTTLETSISTETQNLSAYKRKLSELELIKNEIDATFQKFEEWKIARKERYSQYELDIDKLISLTKNTKAVEDFITAEQSKVIGSERLLSETSIVEGNAEISLIVKKDRLIAEKSNIEKDLEKPLKDWQNYQQQLKDWETRKKEILGAADQIDTIVYFENEINYLEKTLPTDLETSLNKRTEIIIAIYTQKQQIQRVYNTMKNSVSEVLNQYSDGQDISIATSFRVDRSFFSQFFDYVNRYGDFFNNGDEELRKLAGKFDFDDIIQVTTFLEELFSKDLRIKDGRRVDFYNYVCSLDFLRPEYDLRLNQKPLHTLSPGEKGGLLLVFYLVLDRDNKPLIIDQPEDNLDNQSVAEILVPYIKYAKSIRQIIMVTHNPNLAIVADAEQIIYMNIDKENQYKVSCYSGGIENAHINNHIVDILEGKMKAFDNRRVKYKK